MGRRRGRRRKEPDLDELEVEDRFIFPGEERLIINGEEIVIEDAEHVVIDGQEYVIIGDEMYALTFTQEAPKETETGSGITGTVVILLIIGGLLYFVGLPFLFGISDDSPSVTPSTSSSSYTVVLTTPTRPITTIPRPVSGRPAPHAVVLTTPTRPITTPTLTREEKNAQLIKNAMDYTNPVTRDFALSIIPESHGGYYNIAQICDLWESVYNRWTYVNDPRGSEYFSPASRTIQIGLKGDCDDFAIVIASLIQSIGGRTRVVTASGSRGGHAYPEVYIGNSEAQLKSAGSYIMNRYHATSYSYHVSYRNNVPEYWLNLDWWSKFPGGTFYDDTGLITAYYSNGYWEKIRIL